MRKKLLLSPVALLLVLALGGEASGQEPPPPSHIVLWSSRGPVAVERTLDVAVAHRHPEQLLRELVQGPTDQERAQGLRTAIPGGTNLAGVIDLSDGTVVVRLQMPLEALQDLGHDSFEIIANQIAYTLTPIEWRDLRIEVQDPDTGDFIPLASFLPDISVPPKGAASTGADAPIAPAYTGQPPAPGQGQPQGALSGKTVYVSAGHGWESNRYVQGWRTQRPPYPNLPYVGPIIEDHNNAEAVNQYFLHYLWNAGAMVWPVRERNLNGTEVLIDNDGAGPDAAYGETGIWTTGAAGMGYAGASYRWASTVAGGPTATATWRASLPADGRYAVYVWYRPGTNRTPDARYIIHHAGGDTTVTIDQRVHGNTWHYLGTYGFVSGEEARVTLTNQSSAPGQAVIADAVRFGGGTFDDLSGIATGATYPPNEPWWEIAAYYHTQKMGMPAIPVTEELADITTRPIYARWEHVGTGDDAVYVSWHTNGHSGYQWDYSGTVSYIYNGEAKPTTPGSDILQRTVHDEIVQDIRVGWDSGWADLGKRSWVHGEVRELWEPNLDPTERQIPGALFEIAYHDHPSDTDALKEPTFNMLVARAMYQGIVKYFEQRDGLNLTLLPEPPTHLTVRNIGDGSVRVSWQPSPTDALDLVGDAATGYLVYTSDNGVGWSDGVLVPGATSTILTDLPADQVVYVRVTAVNAGGESFPTETLAARVGDPAEILLVNGFDRLNSSMLVDEVDPVEGYNKRMLLDRMNRYDYVIQHAEAIPHPFDSTSNEAVQAGTVSLGDYAIVDWILGEESYEDETLNGTEQARLRDFLDGDGALFISGSEIGWDLDHLGSWGDRDFYHRYLKADYAGDDAETHRVAPAPGSIFSGLGTFHFDAPGMYDADYPDQLGTSHGSTAALNYQGGYGGTAAIQFAAGCRRVVTFGFPFETIRSGARSSVMERVLDFLDECIQTPPETMIDSPEDDSAHRTVPPFSGTAEDYGQGLQVVKVLIEDDDGDRYWSGSSWQPERIWLPAEGTSTWSYALPSLLDGRYELRARAHATDGTPDPSPAEVDITMDTVVPAATSGLITPTGGITITAVSVELVWQPVTPDGGTDLGYRVALDGHVYTTTQSSYMIPAIRSGPHQWGVQIFDLAGNRSAWVDDVFSVRQYHFWFPLVLRDFDD
jgi:N-acetylmuramoyl-L-alanine amidase